MCAHSTPSAWDSLFLASSVPAQPSSLIQSSDSLVTHVQRMPCSAARCPQASSDVLCHYSHFVCTYGILDEYSSPHPPQCKLPKVRNYVRFASRCITSEPCSAWHMTVGECSVCERMPRSGASWEALVAGFLCLCTSAFVVDNLFQGFHMMNSLERLRQGLSSRPRTGLLTF